MQTWLRQELQRQQQIIEVCPTSTLRIAGVNATRQHHLHAFLDDALTVVIGSDDPGLFATTLPQECALASHWRGQDLHHLAQQWTAASRQLSGRTGS